MIFEEEAYLRAFPDVRAAVQRGQFQSGYQHFIRHGLKENRLGWPKTGTRTVLFSVSHNRHFFYKLGDMCIAHPVFNAIKEQFSACNVYWMTRRELSGLTSPEAPVSALSSECEVIDAAPSHGNARDWLHSGKHPIDFIARTAGIRIAPRHRYVNIPVPLKGDQAVDAFDLPSTCMVIAAGPCYTGGNWPHAERQKVVDRFNQRSVQCVSIGGKDGVALRDTIDLCGRLSFSQAIAVIKRARLYVGPDTGTSWLACAARETPKVCVIDRNRLRDGLVGFQGFLLDRNIRDVIAQDGAERCFDVAWECWNGIEDDFDEELYLRAHHDVASAVESGQFSSGWEHYSRFGKREHRRCRPLS